MMHCSRIRALSFSSKVAPDAYSYRGKSNQIISKRVSHVKYFFTNSKPFNSKYQEIVQRKNTLFPSTSTSLSFSSMNKSDKHLSEPSISSSSANPTMTMEKWEQSDKQTRHEHLDEIYHVPTLLVPAPYIQALLKPNSPFRSYLAIDVFDGIHPKIKMVRDYKNNDSQDRNVDENKSGREKIPHKLLLLHPKCIISSSSSVSLIEEESILSQHFPGIPQSLYQSHDDHNRDKTKEPSLSSILQSCIPGPNLPITIPYTHLPISTLLQKLLPPEAHPPPTSYEMIGTIAHFNLKSHHIPYQQMIGEILLERFYPQIQTVVNKVGEVKGPYRTYDMEVMASSDKKKTTNSKSKKNPFWVKVVENSLSFEFDIRKVYWCTRLSGERQRLLKEEIIHSNQTIADAFCGVGAFCIHAAKHYNATILANDWNPDAVQYVKDNAKQHGITVGQGKQMEISTGDARDFIRGLGRREEGLPDHLVMNYPLGSPQFLDALRWWPTMKRGNLFRKAGDRRKLKITNSKVFEGDKSINDNDESSMESSSEEKEDSALKQDGTMVHVYTFSKPSLEDGLDAMDMAIDLVAEGLLVEAGGPGDAKEFLNNVLGCEARAKEVRDVAPGKAVICVTFRITDKLIRHMQGDFVA